MVQVNIMGDTFPLALTVGALDEINERCGGLDGINDFLDGKEPGDTAMNYEKAIHNIPWILAVMLREGAAAAEYCGRTIEKVPTEDQLRHILSVKSSQDMRDKIIEAVNESLSQEIEAEYPKNGKSHTEQEK